MSGPKCSEYIARQNEERLRLAKESAWRRAPTYEDALRDLSAGRKSSQSRTKGAYQ
ncbi:MAG: hypothetical protein QNI99_20535 [Woeseiaceae bacterium]|nr:hypothetical protein [Woeseiaceae bacterium]